MCAQRRGGARSESTPLAVMLPPNPYLGAIIDSTATDVGNREGFACLNRAAVAPKLDTDRLTDPHLAPSMSDLDTTPERSALMKRVRREGTEPELAVRRLLHSAGGHYRLNVDDLPGSPDIANKSRSKAIFVHGCFWHFHKGCDRSSIPDRNSSFWRQKFERNRQRDHRNRTMLAEQGFDVLVVWECELEDPGSLRGRLQSFWFDETQD